MKVTLYHNEKCSKSNAVLALLLQQGVSVERINYLETPFSSEQLQSLLKLLDIEAKSLIRFGEPIATELGIGRDDVRASSEWIAFMIQHPILMERPIIVLDNQAIIGRPPEKVLDIIPPH